MVKRKKPVSEPEEMSGPHRRMAELEAEVARLRLSGSSGLYPEALLSSIARNTSDIIYRLDPQGRIVFVNEAVRRYGYEPAQLLGASILDYVHPEDLELARFRLNERRTGERASRILEIRLFTPVGTVEVEYSSSPVTESHVFSVNAEGVYESGRPCKESFLGTQGIARDITEHRRLERKIGKSEHITEAVLNASLAAIVLLDRDGNVLENNTEHARRFGLKREQLIGKPIWPLLPRELAEHRRALVEKVFAEGRPIREEDEGQGIWNEYVIYPVISDQGTVESVAVYAEDITERKLTESTLADEAVRRRILIEQSRDGIVVLDQDGNVFEANGSFAGMLGYAPEEVLLLHVWDWEAQSPREHVLKMLREVDSSGDHFETRHRRKDGTILDVEISTNGAICGGRKLIFCVCRDITERKKVELALRESERRLLEAQRVARIGNWELDIQTNALWWSQEVFRIFGFEEGKFSGTMEAFFECVHPDDQQLMEDVTLAAWNDRQPFSVDHRVIRADGEIRTVHELAEVVFDAAGQPVGMIGTVQDITERKQAEQALRESEERLGFVLAGAGMGWWDWDIRAGKVTRSQGWANLLGYTLDEAQKPSLWNEIVHAGDKQRVENAVQDHLDGKTPLVEHEYLVRSKSGEYLWVLSRGRVVERDADGKPLRLSGTIHNITERKRLETERLELERQLQQSQKLESLGVLAGGIAHDFNNILSIISGYTELAESDAMLDPKDVADSLQQVRKATERAKGLTDQILAFSRKSELERIPLKLSLIVKEVVEMLRASIPTTVKISLLIENESGVVVADPTQLHQVLMNLATNSAHAMREHGGKLSIRLGESDLDAGAAAGLSVEPGRYLKLTVSDTGHGIEPAILDRIFDPFFTTKSKGQGTGMGLSVVHGIVRSHGGGITVSSDPGKGTVFDVFFPLVWAEVVQTKKNASMAAGGKERILLVDDEAGLVTVGRKTLEKLGYALTGMTSSLEALRAFESNPGAFDLVITDQTMPDLTGAKLAEKLLQIRADIPIILCTGFSDMLTTESIKTLGIRELVLKPFHWDDMTALIRKVLENR